MHNIIIALNNVDYKLVVGKNYGFLAGDIRQFKKHDIKFIYRDDMGYINNTNFIRISNYSTYLATIAEYKDYYKRYITIEDAGIYEDTDKPSESIGFFAVKTNGSVRGAYREIISEIIADFNWIRMGKVYKYELYKKEYIDGIQFESKSPILTGTGFCGGDLEGVLRNINRDINNKFKIETIEKSIDSLRSI